MKYTILIGLILIIYVSSYAHIKEIYEPMQNLELSTYFNNNKVNVDSIIPLDIYQTWHTKKLPKYMKKCTESIQRDNPEFKYHLYDDDDCRKFIAENFDNDVLYAYDSLIPGAYKADLWRYCILYKKGGIYLDIKYKCMDGFKLITLTDDEYFVKDRTLDFNNRSIYNGFIVSKPNNKILMNCINNISKNVKNRDYCDSALIVSGPILLARNMTPGQIKKIILKYSSNGLNILLKNKVILTIYDEYRIEQTNFQNNLHYGILWLNKNIYN